MPPPSHLHPACFACRLACPRFRMPLGAFARARTTTPTTQAAHTTQAANRTLHSAHSHSHSHAHAHSTILLPPSSPRSPLRSTSPPHQPPLPLLLLASADRFASSESTSAQPQAFSTQRTPPPIISIIITPPTCHTATHIPPLRYCTAQMLLLATGRSHRHRAVQTQCKPPCSTPPSHCTAPSADAPAAACSRAARHLRTATPPLLGTGTQPGSHGHRAVRMRRA